MSNARVPATTTSTTPAQAPTTTLPDVWMEVTIFLLPTVDEAGRLAIEEIVDSVAASYEFVDQEQTFVEFQEYFATDPVLEVMSVEDMPPSFRFIPSAPLDQELVETLEAHPAVRNLVTPENRLAGIEHVARNIEAREQDPRFGLTIVYLHADAGDEGRAEVKTILGNVPGIFFVDQEQTREEFIAFQNAKGQTDDEEFDATAVPASDMPPSWRFDLDGEELPSGVVAELEASPFVRQVTNPAG